MSVARRLVAGAIAGAAGTFVMDSVWYARYRKGGGSEMFTDWEFATSTSSFEDASAPGKVGKKAADAVGIDLPEEAAGLTTNVVHWATGVGYGIGHALLQHHRGMIVGGLGTGVGAFLNSYASLGAIGVYDPIWTYEPETLWKDLTAHLGFGLTTGIVYRTLAGR